MFENLDLLWFSWQGKKIEISEQFANNTHTYRVVHQARLYRVRLQI